MNSESSYMLDHLTISRVQCCEKLIMFELFLGKSKSLDTAIPIANLKFLFSIFAKVKQKKEFTELEDKRVYLDNYWVVPNKVQYTS